MGTELPDADNYSLLLQEFGKNIIDDLETRYPAAFDALLKRTDQELRVIIELQNRTAGIFRELATLHGIDNVQSLEVIMRSLVESSFRQTREDIKNIGAGKVMISVAGPGGAGKDTVLNALGNLLQKTQVKKAVCITTRAIRADDVPGESYHFKTQQDIIGLLRSTRISEENVEALRNLGIDNVSIGGHFDEPLLELIKQKSSPEGLTIFLKAIEGAEEYPLYLTFNPGRGWYTILNTEVDRASKSQLSVVIEDPMIVTNIITSQRERDPKFLGKVICVLPPHPIIIHMALRAIMRDEILALKQLPFEQLISTIGERQIALMNEFLKIPKELFILVVNDQLENGIPTVSYDLLDLFQPSE